MNISQVLSKEYHFAMNVALSELEKNSTSHLVISVRQDYQNLMTEINDVIEYAEAETNGIIPAARIKNFSDRLLAIQGRVLRFYFA